VAKSYYDNTYDGEKKLIRSAFGSFHMGHRLITTTRGRVGLASNDSKQGDLVYVLL
jgi:hypothetical protein